MSIFFWQGFPFPGTGLAVMGRMPMPLDYKPVRVADWRVQPFWV